MLGTLAGLLGGCLNLSGFTQLYGHATPDDDPVRADGKPTYIPPNAPSIHNSYGSVPDKDDYEEPEGHLALDFIAPRGTPVIAAADGVVTDSHYGPMYGNQITLYHGQDVDGKFVWSSYFHLDSRLVKEGQKIRRGEQIGTLGETGTLALLLPHLHFQILVGKTRDQFPLTPDNPNRYWVDGPGYVTCFDRHKRYPDRPIRITHPVVCKDMP